MRRFIYLDTSALARWAEGDVSSPEPRNIAGRDAVSALLGDPEVTLGLTNLTLVEYYDAIGGLWRSTEKPWCDQVWAERSVAALMAVLAGGRFEVLTVPTRVLEHAVVLMTIATRAKIAFHAWDAIHLIVAARWADTLGAGVELATSDSDFRRFAGHFPYFGSFVRIFDVC